MCYEDAQHFLSTQRFIWEAALPISPIRSYYFYHSSKDWARANVTVWSNTHSYWRAPCWLTFSNVDNGRPSHLVSASLITNMFTPNPNPSPTVVTRVWARSFRIQLDSTWSEDYCNYGVLICFNNFKLKWYIGCGSSYVSHFANNLPDVDHFVHSCEVVPRPAVPLGIPGSSTKAFVKNRDIILCWHSYLFHLVNNPWYHDVSDSIRAPLTPVMTGRHVEMHTYQDMLVIPGLIVNLTYITTSAFSHLPWEKHELVNMFQPTAWRPSYDQYFFSSPHPAEGWLEIGTFRLVLRRNLSNGVGGKWGKRCSFYYDSQLVPYREGIPVSVCI